MAWLRAPTLPRRLPAACRRCPRQQFAVTATKRDGALDMGLKSTYTAAKYTVVSTMNQSGKVRLAGGSHIRGSGGVPRAEGSGGRHQPWLVPGPPAGPQRLRSLKRNGQRG